MTYRILNKKDKAEIYLYSDIGEGWFGGISSKQFAEDIKNLGKISQIDLRINSPGGSVFEGVAMYNVLASHSARINVFIDGLAASIASIVAMAGDYIQIADNALMMIHDPWGMAVGSSDDMRKEADVLDTIRETLVDTYVKRTGANESDVSEWMKAETWMNAKESVDRGFADANFEEMKAAASIDLSRYRYRNMPRAVARINNRSRAQIARIDHAVRRYSIARIPSTDPRNCNLR